MGVVDFGPRDVLVGLTMKVTSSSTMNPRQLGFIVMRTR